MGSLVINDNAARVNTYTITMMNQEIFPEYIKFVKDTDEHRRILESNLGKPVFMFCDYSYIEIDLQKNAWWSCLDYEWLYRLTPPLITIEELISIIRSIKIKEIDCY